MKCWKYNFDEDVHEQCEIAKITKFGYDEGLGGNIAYTDYPEGHIVERHPDMEIGDIIIVE